MQLRNAILEEHSRAQSLKIAAWIGNKPERVEQLMQLFLHGEYRVVQRAARIVSMVGEKHPGLLAPHLPVMVQRMQEEGIPVAVKRNVVRVLQYMPVPRELQGSVMDICFALLADPRETVAVRCFSMTVLAGLAAGYPEIRNEIRLVVEDELARTPAPAFRSRARRVLKQIGSERGNGRREGEIG